MTFEEKINRIFEITDFYLSRFWRTQIGIFNLPTTAPNPYWFLSFINTLMVTLRRKNFMPYNFWIRDTDSSRFILILWVSGYFRTDLSDLAPVVQRFWAFHSPEPATAIGCFPLSLESTVEEQLQFRNAIGELIQVSPSGGWHQHSFGGSQLR